MEKFTVKLPLTGEYLTTVRLTTGGLCALVGFDVDGAEDFKVGVTESLLILKRNGFTTAEIEYSVSDSLACKVTGVGACGEKEDSFEDEISCALLSALVKNTQIKKDADKVVGIEFAY